MSKAKKLPCKAVQKTVDKVGELYMGQRVKLMMLGARKLTNDARSVGDDVATLKEILDDIRHAIRVEPCLGRDYYERIFMERPRLKRAVDRALRGCIAQIKRAVARKQQHRVPAPFDGVRSGALGTAGASLERSELK